MSYYCLIDQCFDGKKHPTHDTPYSKEREFKLTTHNSLDNLDNGAQDMNMVMIPWRKRKMDTIRTYSVNGQSKSGNTDDVTPNEP